MVQIKTLSFHQLSTPLFRGSEHYSIGMRCELPFDQVIEPARDGTHLSVNKQGRDQELLETKRQLKEQFKIAKASINSQK